MAASESETSLSPAEETENSTSRSRKRRRDVAFDNYMEGISRKAYRVKQDIEDAQMRMGSPPTLSVKVCHSYSNPLSCIKEMFNGLKRQGSDLRKRRGEHTRRHIHDSRLRTNSYRNLVLQNEWLRANIFDTMGNYLFCQECVCVLHYRSASSDFHGNET